MKNPILFTVMTILSSSSAFAASEQLYSAIKAPEVDARPTRDGIPEEGANIYSKSVGGLVCKKTTFVYPGAKPGYNCSLSSGGLDAGAIYEALDLDETDARPTHDGIPADGANIYLKSIEGLACKKTTGIYPGAKPYYVCSVSF